LRLFSFGGYGLALAALALVVIGAIEYPPIIRELIFKVLKSNFYLEMWHISISKRKKEFVCSIRRAFLPDVPRNE